MISWESSNVLRLDDSVSGIGFSFLGEAVVFVDEVQFVVVGLELLFAECFPRGCLFWRMLVCVFGKGLRFR